MSRQNFQDCDLKTHATPATATENSGEANGRINFGLSGAIKKQPDFSDFPRERQIRNTNGTFLFRLLIYITLSEIFWGTGTLPLKDGRCSTRALKAARFGYWLCQS